MEDLKYTSFFVNWLHDIRHFGKYAFCFLVKTFSYESIIDPLIYLSTKMQLVFSFKPVIFVQKIHKLMLHFSWRLQLTVILHYWPVLSDFRTAVLSLSWLCMWLLPPWLLSVITCLCDNGDAFREIQSTQIWDIVQHHLGYAVHFCFCLPTNEI